MRSADGLALLREIARKHGSVEIVWEAATEEWIVNSNLLFASGETLEATAAALYDRLEAREPRAV